MTVVERQKTFSTLFPVPEFLLLSTTGLTLSDKSIKFTKFKRPTFGEDLKLHEWGKVVLPIGAVESGSIQNEGKVISSLKSLASKHELSFIRATLPDEKAYLFTATIDKVPEESLRDAVAFIIEENVPVSLVDSVFDFVALETPDPNKVKVTVSVVLKETVESYFKVFNAAGITPISFDIESQAIARAIIPAHDSTTTLIINLGERKASFYVVEDGVVRLSTTPAQSILGGDSPVNVPDLKEEMKKVFIYWNAHREVQIDEGKEIEKILLTGVGALNNSLVDELMRGNDLEYNLADPWVNTLLPENNTQILSQSLEYIAAVGAAIHRK